MILDIILYPNIDIYKNHIGITLFKKLYIINLNITEKTIIYLFLFL